MDNKALASEWFDAARSDLKYSEVGLKEKTIFPQVAFLAEQVAEKYLKGFLFLNGVEPPRIHDLPKLLDECVKINNNLKNIRDSCELLAGFYVETRYPPDMPDLTKEEIKKAVLEAKQVKDTIDQIIT